MEHHVEGVQPPPAWAFARGKAAADSIRFYPYWWNAVPRRLAPPEPLPAKADVLIIGSGYTGLSAALTLVRAGRRVVVVDCGPIGSGASTRNGGQIGSGNQKFRVAALVAARGQKMATALLREGVEMLNYIEHLIRSEKIACHFRRCGRFRGAMRPAHYDSMARDMDDLRKIAGVESFMVPKADQHSEIGSDIFFGGSVLPQDASLHPGLYHEGLVGAVERLGGTLVGNAGASAIDARDGAFAVKTAAGEILCRDVIIATNGYTNALVPALHRRLVPVGSAHIVTGELPIELMSKLLPKNRVYGNSNRVFSYFRAAPGERKLVWGGRVGHFNSETTVGAYRHLARDMLRTFPDLAHSPITQAWEGLIGYTFDALPHLGVTRERVHYALGYCGTGVSRATYFGNKIALRLLGDPEGRTAFSAIAFPHFPIPAAARLAVPAVESWYRTLDRLGR